MFRNIIHLKVTKEARRYLGLNLRKSKLISRIETKLAQMKQAFQQELLRQNKKLRRKAHADNLGSQGNSNTQDKTPSTQVKEWLNKMDKLHRDVRALHPKSRDMDWLFCFNNSLAPKIVTISFPCDSKSVELTSDDDELIHDEEGNDSMVVSATVVGFKVKRIVTDNDSAVEVSWKTYKKMGLKEQSLSIGNPLYSFTNHPVEVKGPITLLVTLGDGKHTTTKYVQSYLVDHLMAYNAIFSRPIMRMANMVIAAYYMKIKFLTSTGVDFLLFDQRMARQ
ncbi:hypothetical protein J1N35_008213 [Gossypium stocksii]|uniref:Uncharacterized protein n=1 Tax=Gossypium stocksii TaxID=47602 RepID=A0A9D3WAL2_9ROSI|nr:hypothetical protein J1N35_008213 [Gossypium stocksii]